MSIKLNFTNPSERRVKLSILIGIIAGIVGGFVKWGWEVPFPPRNPAVPWPLEGMTGAVQSSGIYERVTPPSVFLEQLGFDPANFLTYTFSGIELPLSIFLVHMGFSVFFGLLYCVVAEYWPRITMWQGAVFGFFVYIFAHCIVMPLQGLVPPFMQIPFDENFSELFGHIFWLWVMELVRRDLRNRITKEPDIAVK